MNRANTQHASLSELIDALTACRALGMHHVTVTTTAVEGTELSPRHTFRYHLDADALRPSTVLTMQRHPGHKLSVDDLLDIDEAKADVECDRLADADGRW